MRYTNLKLRADAKHKMGKGARLRTLRLSTEIQLATRIARLKDEDLRVFLTNMMRVVKYKQQREILGYLKTKNGGEFNVTRHGYRVVLVFRPHKTPGPFTLSMSQM